ncbi:MAG: phytanoyl-CoA hydroxylase [Spirosomataceae bacterium]|jgi:hypothetical protein
MPIIDQKSFWENGYSLIKNLFDPEEVINIRKKSIAMAQRQLVAVGLLDKLNPELPEEEFNKLFFELFDKYPERIISTGKHIQHGMDLHRISLDKRIEEGLNDIGLSFPNICTRPMLFFNARKLAKKQVYWKTDPHQDWRSMQGSLNAIVVWLPLIDVPMSLGALEIVPKSHKFGLRTNQFTDGFGTLPPEEAEKHSWEPVEVKAGDALFFSSMLYHRSGSNDTENGIRWSCHFRYNDMDEPTFIERGFPHPYIYHPNPDIITPDFPTEQDIEKAYGV